MNKENKTRPPKKGIPGGFLLIFFSLLVLFFMSQQSSSHRSNQVSFSYQAEHLVNLDLLQPDSGGSKIAPKDNNLVSFSGQFRDRLTEEGRARFKYLEFLNRNHELRTDESLCLADLDKEQKEVVSAATLFLQLTGASVPREGYCVISPALNTANRNNEVVIHNIPPFPLKNLKDFKAEYLAGETSNTQLAQDLLSLVQAFRSSALGIGEESLKNLLKEIENNLQSAISASSATLFSIVEANFEKLQSLVAKLQTEQGSARLVGLRSVRSYLASLQEMTGIEEELSRNILQLDKSREAVLDVSWFFNNQELSTRALEKQDFELFSRWFQQAKQEWLAFPSNQGLSFEVPYQPRNLVLEKTFKTEEPSTNYLILLLNFLPVLLIVFLLYFVFSRQMKGMGASAMNFGKSPAKLLTKDKNRVTFKDVAGCDEAKEELQEIVDFLKDPSKFTALGARIPKGVLCIGAPGTGKTLIAKAVAGEAERPFFFISGSDFVEMFVGVGASRIRDMFTEARKSSPCIIFMDEIDAVGRHRGGGIGGGHDEREQTLNQLLVEMDGFDPSEGIILIAATNRPDVLDRALLRPGRFDRRIVIDLPDVKGRYEILKVHARRIKMDDSVDLMDIARSTPGASGADLMNILNEAALLAARRNRTAVTASEAKEACDKVRYGKERRSLEVDEGEKRTTAYHESGHAIVGLSVKHADPVDKVTIIPRGLSLGATHFMPKKNRLSYWRKELLDHLAVLMGGRAAEEIFVSDISSGAQMDFSQATSLARRMVCEWGMTEILGPMAYDERSESGAFLGGQGLKERSYSEKTSEIIDEQVRKLLEEAYTKAKDILQKQKDKVELMTSMLMEFETLDKEDVLRILHGTWDIEEKRSRLKLAADLHKKIPAPSPRSSVQAPLVPPTSPQEKGNGPLAPQEGN